MHDVQIRQARLDHHHVRALLNVQGDFPQGLIGVGGIHLIGPFAFLAQVGARSQGVSERVVKPGGVFGGVSQQTSVLMAVGVQGPANGAYAPVHHVRRRDDVDARRGLGQGLFDQDFYGGVVGHTALVIQQPVVAVGGEGIQGHIRDHAQARRGGLHGLGRDLRQALRVEGLSPVRGLFFLWHDGKQRQGRNAKFRGGLGLARQQVQAEAFHPRHGGNGFAPVFPFHDKDRIDQVVHREGGLAHQPAGEIIRAHAAQARGGVGAGVGALLGHPQDGNKKPWSEGAGQGPSRPSGQGGHGGLNPFLRLAGDLIRVLALGLNGGADHHVYHAGAFQEAVAGP